MSSTETSAAPVHLCVVCTGNICRSPIGEKVLQARFSEAGLGDRVRVTSAGTGDWHVGDGADPGSVRVLRAHGYPTDHVAAHLGPDDVADLDLVLVADRSHLTRLRRYASERGSDPGRVVLLRSFDPDADGDEIPDPWGLPDAAFEDVLAMIEAAAPGVVDHVRSNLLTGRGSR